MRAISNARTGARQVRLPSSILNHPSSIPMFTDLLAGNTDRYRPLPTKINNLFVGSADRPPLNRVWKFQPNPTKPKMNHMW